MGFAGLGPGIGNVTWTTAPTSPVRWRGELGRCGGVLCGADGAGAGGGADCGQQCLPSADGGGVGVCVSGVDLDAVQLWG
jgi:hypothetical protein